MALADVNGDGAVEITLAHRPVLMPTTYRTFSVSAAGSMQIDSFTAAFGTLLTVGDFDGNGTDDLAYRANPGAGTILHVRRFSGSTVIDDAAPTAVTTTVASVDAADLDGDGDDEWIEIGSGGPLGFNTTIRSGGPTNVFLAPPRTGTAGFGNLSFFNPANMRSRGHDLDGDGIADLIVELWIYNARYRAAAHFDPTASVPFATQAIDAVTFEPVNVYPTASPKFFNQEIDFDGDGDLDDLQATSDGFLSGIIYRENPAIFGVGHAGQLGIPTLDAGSAVIGNNSYSIDIASAAPFATAILLLSQERSGTSSGILVDLSPGSLLSPLSALPTVFTDGTGIATYGVAIPNLPSLRGFRFFAQWAVLDPAGQFSTSGVPIATSAGRGIVVL